METCAICSSKENLRFRNITKTIFLRFIFYGLYYKGNRKHFFRVPIRYRNSWKFERELEMDLFHKWRLLHGNETCVLFSQSTSDYLFPTTKLTWYYFWHFFSFEGLGLVFKVSFRIRIILLFSDFSRDKKRYVWFRSWKQILTD